MTFPIPRGWVPCGVYPLAWSQHAEMRWQERLGYPCPPVRLRVGSPYLELRLCCSCNDGPRPHAQPDDGPIFEAWVRYSDRAYKMVLVSKIGLDGEVVGMLVLTVKRFDDFIDGHRFFTC